MNTSILLGTPPTNDSDYFEPQISDLHLLSIENEELRDTLEIVKEELISLKAKLLTASAAFASELAKERALSRKQEEEIRTLKEQNVKLQASQTQPATLLTSPVQPATHPVTQTTPSTPGIPQKTQVQMQPAQPQRRLHQRSVSFITPPYAARLGRTTEESEADILQWLIGPMGIHLHNQDLYECLKDGIVLLQVFEKIQSGCVDWKKVATKTTALRGKDLNLFQMVTNCDYAVTVAQKILLPIRLPGICPTVIL